MKDDARSVALWRERSLLVGGAVLAALCTIRLLVPLAPLPFFDADPAMGMTAIAQLDGPAQGFLDVVTASISAIGPSASVAIDLAIIAVCCLVVGVGGGVPIWWCVLALVGTAWLHFRHLGIASPAPSPSPEDLRIASAWTAGIFAAIAGSAIARHGRARALAAGVLLGVIALLALKGVMQVLVEHPQTIAMFDADPQGSLRARGFEPGSPQALIYERRLRQPEATGWIALSNVFATLVGSAGIAFGVVAWRTKGAARWIAGALALAAAVALALSGSKGGWAATAFGLGMVACGALLAGRLKRPSIAGALGLAAIAVPLAAVVARGLAGTAIGELSLLFRWFYMIGSARIIGSEPIFGVGPDGFQDAYARLKPAISPEDVASPHSVMLDYIATMGLGGWAWCVLLGVLAWRVGRSLAAGPEPQDAPTAGLRLRLYVAAMAIVPVAFAALWLDRGAALPLVVGSAFAADPIPMWALGVGLVVWGAAVAAWIASAAALPVASERTVAIALAGAALAGLAHVQIEMTATQPSTAAWLLLLIGLAAPARQPERRGRVAAPVVLAFGLLGPTGSIGDQISRDVTLTRAAQRLAPIGAMRADLASAAADGSPAGRQAMALLADRVSQRLGQRVPPRADAVAAGIARLSAVARLEAAGLLAPMAERGDEAVLRVRTRQVLAFFAETGDPRLLPEPVADPDRAGAVGSETPTELIATANLHLARGEPGNITVAAALLARAAELRPHDLDLAMRLERLFREHEALLGPGWRAWGERALAIDGRLELDPLVRLTESERSGLRERLSEP